MCARRGCADLRHSRSRPQVSLDRAATLPRRGAGSTSLEFLAGRRRRVRWTGKRSSTWWPIATGSCRRAGWACEDPDTAPRRPTGLRLGVGGEEVPDQVGSHDLGGGDVTPGPTPARRRADAVGDLGTATAPMEHEHRGAVSGVPVTGCQPHLSRTVTAMRITRDGLHAGLGESLVWDDQRGRLATPISRWTPVRVQLRRLTVGGWLVPGCRSGKPGP